MIIFLQFSWPVRGESLDMRKFKLIGSSLIEVTIFKIDVYQANYFTGISAANNSSLLELDYKIDVEKKHSLEGWKEGFKNLDKAKYKDAIDWIYRNTPDVKKGDKFSIKKKADEVIFYHNGVLISKIKNKKVSFLSMYPWIGDKPLDDKIKRDLLGN